MSVDRLHRLQVCIKEAGYGGIAVNAGPSLNYLTGLDFHLMERPVVMLFPVEGEPTIILPQLEKRKIDNLHYSAKVFAYGEDPAKWGDVFKQALQEMNFSHPKIGVDPRQLRLLEYDYLRSAGCDLELIDGSAIVAALRSIKDEEEIACMREAVKIAENALEATLAITRVGVSEKEIASELFLQLIRGGSETSLPFSPIVASGPNGANPHAKPSSRKLSSGDLLIIDWGARYGGYASDLTRTFGVGKINKEAEKIHKTVQQANEAGRAAGKPGVSCASVDQAARQCIENSGFGDYFTHRTGHGIGMECHEEPYIRAGNEQLLEVGMTYTVEPGIYLIGRNGVRIEDDVVVTAEGSESLSTMSREIRYIE
jgi:Xaa-Pro dipeptidase